MYATVDNYLYKDYSKTDSKNKANANNANNVNRGGKVLPPKVLAEKYEDNQNGQNSLMDTNQPQGNPPQHPSSQVGSCQCNPSGNTSDPKVWGPAFWYTLHVSAAHYPLQASQIVKERMKYRLLAIPYEVPCLACRTHASAFIEKNRDRLDEIVSGRHNLGQFYVDFHNQVNKRYNKPEWTYAQAYKKYAGTA